MLELILEKKGVFGKKKFAGDIKLPPCGKLC
jgi:hypothetical protein